ncbi:unnamed protein product, partial [marine sediment metagenome]
AYVCVCLWFVRMYLCVCVYLTHEGRERERGKI